MLLGSIISRKPLSVVSFANFWRTRLATRHFPGALLIWADERDWIRTI